VIELRDSRRLTGPNLFCAQAGAVLDVAVSEELNRPLVAAWTGHARALLDAVGWGAQSLHSRRFSGGVSLVLTAPIDALYAATEVNEAAFASARADLEGLAVPPRDEQVRRLVHEIGQESSPALLRLRDAAAAHGVLFLSDPVRCSVGAGSGCRRFYVDELPDPETLDWGEIHDVPLAVVTGTNGKSTTVRAVAAMLEAAGKTPGITSTDGVQVGDEILERGDYSGPGGARGVLRDRYVDAAVLEAARGGLLRRGLGVPRAEAVAVLNVSEDHLGEFGMDTLEDLVETKLIVRHAVLDGGGLVLGLDDPSLLAWCEARDVEVDAFAIDPAVAQRIRTGAFGGRGAWVEDGAFHVRGADGVTRLLAVDEAPMTLRGAAVHNVLNALAAVLVALRLGVGADDVRRGLLAFGRDATSNPGRTTLLELAGIRILADYAHNPHGLAALFDTARRLPHARVLLVLGQAGDRGADAVRGMCRVAWAGRPDRILIKEMEHFLRGREPGEVPGLLEAELRRLGAGAETVVRCGLELDAVRDALLWARPGDLLLLPLHEHRDEALALIEQLRESDWQPGQVLPV
jgi:UDP-N-acetylmuramyl tripeptide synthase